MENGYFAFIVVGLIFLHSDLWDARYENQSLRIAASVRLPISTFRWILWIVGRFTSTSYQHI
jgi:hypothetical protein